MGTTARVPALLRHPKAELVAVHHRDQATAKKIAADFNVPHGLSTVAEVLAIDSLQAVVISSTPNVHYQQAKSALERGLHVLIEKPMMLKVAEAQELVQLADQ